MYQKHLDPGVVAHDIITVLGRMELLNNFQVKLDSIVTACLKIKLFKVFVFIYFVLICYDGGEKAPACHVAHVEVRGQPWGTGSLLPCRSQELNSGHQVWK